MAWNEPGPGRDPWAPNPGGNKGGDKRGDKPPSVPDIQQLIKRLQRRFGGGRGTQPLIAAAVCFVVAAWLLSGFYSVDDKEQGVVLRFGAFERVTDAGLHWRLPWPAEQVVRVDVTQVRQARERDTVLTKDQNLVLVELQVQYHVSSAQDYLFNISEPESALQILTRSALTEAAGDTDVDALLGDSGGMLGPKVQKLLQQGLDAYRSGITVTSVGVQQIEPPDAVKAAFADEIKAHEDADRLRQDAQAYSDSRLPNARGEAAQKIAESTAYRDEAIARAEGDVARFEAVLEQYRKAPKVTRERLYLDTMSAIYANTTKVLVNADKSNPVIYLPLDQLLKNMPKAPSETPDAAAGATPSNSHATPGAGPGNSDTNRSRDRGSR